MGVKLYLTEKQKVKTDIYHILSIGNARYMFVKGKPKLDENFLKLCHHNHLLNEGDHDGSVRDILKEGLYIERVKLSGDFSGE